VEANENEIRRANEAEEERRCQLHRYEKDIQVLETQLALSPKIDAYRGRLIPKLTLKKAKFEGPS